MTPPVPLCSRAEADEGFGFRPALQGLRAIAIMLVVLAHAGVTLFGGGFVGVDVFFVLSGYLISGLLLRELGQSGGIAFARFYARRLRRLLPALIVMLGLTAAAAHWLLSGVEARAQLASAPFAATWISNLYFAFTTIDYFDELATRDLFLHTWSLGVEEQFYLVWPILLLALFVIGCWKRSASRYPMGFVSLTLVFLVSLALSLYWSMNAPHAALYLMPSRIWQFALGAMVYLAFQNVPLRETGSTPDLRRTATAAWLALMTGLLLILGSAVLLRPNQTYPGF